MQKGDVLGHEFMGIVHEVGPAVRGLAKGDRCVAAFCISCGECDFCKKARRARGGFRGGVPLEAFYCCCCCFCSTLSGAAARVAPAARQNAENSLRRCFFDIAQNPSNAGPVHRLRDHQPQQGAGDDVRRPVSDSLRAAQPRLAHSSEPSRSPPPVARRPPPVAAPRPTPSAAAAAAASPEPERRSGGFFGYSHITSGYDGGQAEFVRCARARSAPSAAAATARRRLASIPSLSLRPLAPTPSPTSPSPSPQRPLCRREPPEGPALAAGREGAVPVRQPAHRLVRLRVRRRGPRLQRRYLGRRCESARPLAPPEWGARRRVRSAACAPPRARHRVRAAACAPPRARCPTSRPPPPLCAPPTTGQVRWAS